MAHFLSVLLAVALNGSPALAGTAEAPPPLKISGAPNGKTSLGVGDFAKLPRLEVGAIDRDGSRAQFEGWALDCSFCRQCASWKFD